MKHLFMYLLIFFQVLLLQGQVMTIEQNRVQIPVLKGRSFSPVLQFRVHSAQMLEWRQVVIEFNGTTDMSDIDSIYLIDMGQKDSWSSDKNPIIQRGKPEGVLGTFSFLEPFTAKNKYFLVAVKLTKNTSLNHTISVGIHKIIRADQSTIIPPADTQRLHQRIGVAVKQGGDSGVLRYRIPGLVCTKKNTLLALYDVRWDKHRDLQGNIDIGLSRSLDGGNTWAPMRIVLDMGEYGQLPQKFNGVSDACFLVDTNTDAIYIAGCWMHGVVDHQTGQPVSNLTNDSTNWNHQWRHYGSLQGFELNESSQFLITKSVDDGMTWSTPQNITQQIKNKDWHLLAPAPGSGITLDNGTLVFPTQGKDENQQPFSNITYSLDGGHTWKASKPSYSNTTESMVVQLGDGSIMQNMRDNRNRKSQSDTNGRAVFITKDLGENWIQHTTHHNALIEPVCMASLFKHVYYDHKGKTKSILLFSNPNSTTSRERMTIKVSLDDGKTWPKKYWLLLDQLHLSGGYSSLTSINNDTIGILYEGSQAQMTFESIHLSELGIKDAR